MPIARAVGRLRLDRLARRPQQHAEIAVGVGVLRIDRDGTLVGGDRLVEPAGLLQHDAEIVVAVGPIGTSARLFSISATASPLRPC